MTPEPPLAILLELTHRCPLACPYCSNPVQLASARDEMPTEEWRRVIRQAAELGVVHLHFSGGEPLGRADLEQLVETAAQAGLYTNLITSGLRLTQERALQLAALGLEHVQLSFQSSEPDEGDLIAGRAGAHRRKLEAAAAVKTARLALTINFVLHRRNLRRIEAAVDLAIALGAERLELAHAQYHGWAHLNREALLPAPAETAEADASVETARARAAGRLSIDYVPCDLHARRPKACMGGWGRRFLVVSPAGLALPCHAAETIPGLTFDSVRRSSLEAIWRESPALQRFRGADWLPETCRQCPLAELDFAGCRCQALALAGSAEAMDPVCEFSPRHAKLPKGSPTAPADWLYRGRASS